MAAERRKLTKRVVESVVPGTSPVKLWDTQVPGFHVEVRPSGKRSFYLYYRVKGGRGATQRRSKIGDFGALTVDAARDKARSWAAMVADGGDPAGQRRDDRRAPRMSELFARYLNEHARPHKKPSSLAEDERIIRDYLTPSFGKRKVAEVSRAEVAKFHAGMADKPYRANRSLALLSKAFNLAEVWGLRPDSSNPCRHIKKYAEKARNRFLSPAELGRLGEALQQAENGELGAMMPSAIHAVRLLVLTGMRSGEVMTLQWNWLDYDAGRINLPDSKSGEKIVPLNAPALAVLNAIPRIEGNPHVIVGGKPGAHLVNLKDPWAVIRRAAGLEDVRIHDLRHSFAAVGAGSGASLHIIGGLLGHSQPQTTKRYAHLADDPLRAASERIGRQIASWLDGSPGADVKAMPPSRRVP